MKNRKEVAVQLREAGYSYGYIKEKTGLAMSTLSYHLARIPYSPNKHTRSKIKNAQLTSAKTKDAQKKKRLSLAKRKARLLLGKISQRDVVIAGIALYIGEGSKTNNLVRLVNADPAVVCFFIRWLGVLGVPRSHIVIRIHAYLDSDTAQMTKFWIETTGLLPTQFQRPCIDMRVNKDRRRSAMHTNGTAHVTIKANGNPEFGTALARLIRELMNIVLH